MTLFESYLNEAGDFFEKEEIARTKKELHLKMSVDKIINLFEESKEEPLTYRIWRQLENTDFDVKTEEDVLQKLK